MLPCISRPRRADDRLEGEANPRGLASMMDILD